MHKFCLSQDVKGKKETILKEGVIILKDCIIKERPGAEGFKHLTEL